MSGQWFVTEAIRCVLRNYCKDCNLTQMALARKVGMSNKSISSFLGARADRIRLLQLIKILGCVGVSMAQFECDITAKISEFKELTDGKTQR